MPKLTQFKEVLKLVNSGLTKEEFVGAFKSVIEFLKRRENYFTASFNSLALRLDNAIKDFLDIKNFVKSEISKGIVSVQKEVETQINEINAKFSEIKPIDEDKIAEKASKLAQNELLPQIPTIEQVEEKLPMLGNKIRDGLELLQGKDRLEMKAIDGLIEALEELKVRPIGKVGGGFSKIAMDQHILAWTETTTQPNGVLTDFVLSHAPNPVNSLEVMIGNSPLFSTDDWTYTPSTRTISFGVAPPPGQKLRYKSLL